MTSFFDKAFGGARNKSINIKLIWGNNTGAEEHAHPCREAGKKLEILRSYQNSVLLWLGTRRPLDPAVLGAARRASGYQVPSY